MSIIAPMIHMSCRKLFCSVVLMLLFLGSKAEADAGWLEVRSPNFRVLTDGSAQQGRDVAAQFEQMRHVFVLRFNDQSIGAGAPLTIVAARNSGTFKTLEPTFWKYSKGDLGGEFHRGWEKQFATIILDSAGDDSHVVVFHEYTHSVLHARIHWLPIWLDEGLAEFYGYTRFEQNRILIGAPSRRIAALARVPLLPVNEMLETTDETELGRDPMKGNLFYAESWGMVHYMMFGKGMDGGVKLNVFFKKLQDGEPQKDAFKDVFGDTRAFDQGLSLYLQGFTLTAGILPADAKVDVKSFLERQLTAAETEYELGCFQIGAHEEVLGRARIEKSLVLNPKLAGAYEELGYLEFQKGNDTDAAKQWRQSVDMDATRARSLFALAMLGKSLNAQSTQELAVMQKTLQHIIDLSPGFAPAYVELGMVDWRLGLIQTAYKEVSKAEKLEPSRAGYHILAGRILLAGHQPTIAAKYARYVADRWAGPDHNEAVDLWESVPTSDRGEGMPLVLDMPAGTKVERGTLSELTCGSGPGVPMLLTVTPDTPGAAPLTFKSDGRFRIGFSDSFWWGEDHFTTCHHLAGHTVIVAYKPEDKHLLDLEVRDDLPVSVKPVEPSQASVR